MKDKKGQNGIRVLGHRGLASDSHVTENTLPAFEHAFDHADGVETDIVLSSENTPFLLHDSFTRAIPYLYSWTRKKSRFNAATKNTAALEKMRLKNGQHIPKLSELFALAAQRHDKIINIELKVMDAVVPTIKAIHKAVDEGLIKKEQIILSSFDHEQITTAKAIDSQLKRGLLFWPDYMRPCRLYPKEKHNKVKSLPLTLKNITAKHVAKAAPDYFIVPLNGLKEKYAKAVHTHHPTARFITWTPSKEAAPENNKSLRKALENPVISPLIDMLISDRPKDMKRYLRTKNLSL